MELARFVAANPRCLVTRPDLVVPALLAGLPALGVVALVSAGVSAAEGGGWLTALCCLAVAVVLSLVVKRQAAQLRRVWSLYRKGHACFAVSDDDLLLVDAVGNAVVVALDRVTGLEADGQDVRVRTDSELQGVIYAVMFQLFDEDVPGPSPEALFEALEPRLRKRSPNAVILRREAAVLT